MAIEIECKFLDVDHQALRGRLQASGAARLGRWFEANEVLDDAERSLKASGTLLRLRTRKHEHILTLKRAHAVQPASAKAYEEHETAVADEAALRLILSALGYAPSLRYEKIREKWALLGCEVCLDTLPFGDYAEIEGPEDAIAACAAALGLNLGKASRATYHALNKSFREERGLPPDDSFVFESGRRTELAAGCDKC